MPKSNPKSNLDVGFLLVVNALHIPKCSLVLRILARLCFIVANITIKLLWNLSLWSIVYWCGIFFKYFFVSRMPILFLGFCYSSLEDQLNERNITPSGHLPRYIAFYIFPPQKNIAFILFILRYPQGASILTGLGFTGLNPKGEPQWDGAANVKVVQIEFAPNFKLLLDAWNIKTNVWLRECVYKRVTPKGKKPGFTSSMITFFTSAFWVCVRFFFGYSRLTYRFFTAWNFQRILSHFPYGRVHHYRCQACKI